MWISALLRYQVDFVNKLCYLSSDMNFFFYRCYLGTHVIVCTRINICCYTDNFVKLLLVNHYFYLKIDKRKNKHWIFFVQVGCKVNENETLYLYTNIISFADTLPRFVMHFSELYLRGIMQSVEFIQNGRALNFQNYHRPLKLQ